MAEIYCLKCRKSTNTFPRTISIDVTRGKNKILQPLLKGICIVCNTRKNKFLPRTSLTNIDITNYARGINDFRGVFSRDNLPEKAELRGSYIINLDSQDGSGTHWVACHVNRNEKYYFDSFGLPPPEEIISFLNGKPRAVGDLDFSSRDPIVHDSIVYSTSQIQGMTEAICGHLCLMILYRLSIGSMFMDIIDFL